MGNKEAGILNPDFGLFLIRLSVGGLMIFHGINKVINGHDFIRGKLAENGWPDFLWLLVPVTEVLAPALLVLGILSRLSGLSVALVMIVAIILAHSADWYLLSESGAVNSELNLLFLFGGLAIFFTGPGKYSLFRPKSPWLA